MNTSMMCMAALCAFQMMAAADTAAWSSSRAQHLFGLPGVKQKAAGKLTVTPAGIGFESNGGNFSVDSNHILGVSRGDQRYLKGGLLGRIARFDIPVAGGIATALSGVAQVYSVVPTAFGVAVSAASQGREDLITVEHLDPGTGYRAAVFAVPNHATDGLEKSLPQGAARLDTNSRGTACPADSPTSLSLLPIASEGADLPAEYRALVYERLVARMQGPNWDGGCSELAAPRSLPAAIHGRSK